MESEVLFKAHTTTSLPVLLSGMKDALVNSTTTHPASPDQDCPQPCHTLDQYAQNTSLFAGHTNISLVFLDGIHILSGTLNIDGVEEISSIKRKHIILFTAMTLE